MNCWVKWSRQTPERAIKRPDPLPIVKASTFLLQEEECFLTTGPSTFTRRRSRGDWSCIPRRRETGQWYKTFMYQLSAGELWTINKKKQIMALFTSREVYTNYRIPDCRRYCFRPTEYSPALQCVVAKRTISTFTRRSRIRQKNSTMNDSKCTGLI